MNYKAIRLLLLTLMTGLTGCASICDCLIEQEICARNKVLSQKAWGHWSWCYEDLAHPVHFASGFKAGYRNVLEGGNGCQPTLPPQKYWKACFQTPEGKCKVYAWFDGFSHGALAAKQDGYDDLGQIPISPTARENLRAAQAEPEELFAEDDGHLTGVGAPADGPTLTPQPLTNGTPLMLPPVNRRPYEE